MDTKTTQSDLPVGGCGRRDSKGRARASTRHCDPGNVSTVLSTTHFFAVVHTRTNYKNNDDESRDDNFDRGRTNTFDVWADALGTGTRTPIDFTNGKLDYL